MKKLTNEEQKKIEKLIKTDSYLLFRFVGKNADAHFNGMCEGKFEFVLVSIADEILKKKPAKKVAKKAVKKVAKKTK